jgi:hypothetical protein
MINEKARSTVLEARGPPGSRTFTPKLGRDGQREIGRALGALYDDVVRQGVPPHIVEILDGLDRPAQGGLDPSAA